MGDDLESIRSKRLAELQKGNQGYDGGEKAKQMEEQKIREQEMKHNMLSQILDQSARARPKPDKAQAVENILIQMANRGQLQGKMDEDQLKEILGKVSEQTQRSTKVKFDRRRAAMDSDDDLDLDV